MSALKDIFIVLSILLLLVASFYAMWIFVLLIVGFTLYWLMPIGRSAISRRPKQWK